ncbi:origin recognition complex subunit 4 C-terminus-domain-containing protein [Jimgerdemannia flammicorona]|uniref:Origin recognition complex subunit 4 C-terminus-domain-containing protein n=1 Tax=Jimgerdemannia flammicorona TaxID=994334 RepID=A0A433QUU9_9FUNG|nr:origin recognition complex subunit 4 C-terminus-domain-containing protein [Jimgerdemannia flammicorona]
MVHSPKRLLPTSSADGNAKKKQRHNTDDNRRAQGAPSFPPIVEHGLLADATPQDGDDDNPFLSPASQKLVSRTRTNGKRSNLMDVLESVSTDGLLVNSAVDDKDAGSSRTSSSRRGMKVGEQSSSSATDGVSVVDPLSHPPCQWSEEDIEQARTSILDRISERTIPNIFIGLSEQYNEVYDLLERTVAYGESNSCLLLGNRGTGKTMVIRRALQTLDAKYNNDAKVDKTFIVVRLNGLAQTDDRLALREITRQLCFQQELEQRSFSSFADCLAFLLSLLKSGTRSNIPVVFVLDEFDLFAQHPKQALLYNLFDVAQSGQNPVAVIGMSCRLDTMELLEKRVKSRFSHRQIYLFPPEQFKDFMCIVRATLALGDEVRNEKYKSEFNAVLEVLLEDPSFIQVVRRVFDLTKDLRMFYKICFEPVSLLSPQRPFWQLSDFYNAGMQQRADAKTELLKGVSILELCLIVAMKKLLERDCVTFNFEMVYDEYKEFMDASVIKGQGFGMKLYKRAVAMKVRLRAPCLVRARPTHRSRGAVSQGISHDESDARADADHGGGVEISGLPDPGEEVGEWEWNVRVG